MIIVLFDDAVTAAAVMVYYASERPTVKINQTARSPYVVHVAVISVLCIIYRVP